MQITATYEYIHKKKISVKGVKNTHSYLINVSSIVHTLTIHLFIKPF